MPTQQQRGWLGLQSPVDTSGHLLDNFFCHSSPRTRVFILVTCLDHAFALPVAFLSQSPGISPLQQALPVGRLCRCGLVRHGGSATSLLSLCRPPPAHIRVPPVGVLLLCDTEQQLDMMKAPVPFLTVFGDFVLASSPSKNAQRSLT